MTNYPEDLKRFREFLERVRHDKAEEEARLLAKEKSNSKSRNKNKSTSNTKQKKKKARKSSTA